MTSYTFRIDEDLKNQAFSVFKSYGLNPAQAIKMYLRQVVETNSVPVKLDYQPNAATIAAMQESLNEKNEIYDNLDEMHRAILGNENVKTFTN